jgi:hypothetical protein
VFVVIVLAIACLVIANNNQTEPSRADVIAEAGLMPVASSPASVSSAFYCAGGTAAPGGAFDSTLVIANPNSTTITTTVTVYPAAAPGDAAGAAAVAALQPAAKQFTVGPLTRLEVRPGLIQPSPFAAALVETSDPGVAVERRVVGSQGFSTSACASAPSKTWYLPTGTTTRDAHEFLAIFNPFPADAVVDVTFQTNDGFRAPVGLQGLPIPGRQLRIVDVTAEAPRLEQLAAFVTARSGQLIVDRLQAFDGSDPNHAVGVAASLGAPEAGSVWTFPNGVVTDGISESITVMNPGDEPALVQLEVALVDPATNGFVDPIPITVPPRGYDQVAMQNETRIPKSVAHSVTVRSTSGPGVVAERVFHAVAPATPRGYAPALGSPLRSTRWEFADGNAVSGSSAQFLVLFNPSPDGTARVSVTVLAQGQALAVDGLQGVEIPPGSRLALDLGEHVERSDLPLIAETTLPTVIERGLFVASGVGISYAPGIPMTGTASVPQREASTTTTTTTMPAPAPPPTSAN